MTECRHAQHDEHGLAAPMSERAHLVARSLGVYAVSVTALERLALHALWVVSLASAQACAGAAPLPAAGSSRRGGDPHAFVSGLIRAWPPGAERSSLAVSSPATERVSSYDNALLALYLMRRDERERAGSILLGLAELQRPDGSLPFTFKWPAPDDTAIYLRSGAIAWVG
mgnify:CR=1 FL=1